MNLKRYIHIDELIKIPMILLVVSFVVFSTEYYGRYIMMGCIFIIFFITIVKNKGVYKFNIPIIFFFWILLIIYTFTSCLWSVSPKETLGAAKSLIEILFMIFVVYNYFCHVYNPVCQLLSIIKISSVIVVLYTVYYYGLTALIEMGALGIRLQNGYANVNTVGILAAIGILIQINEFLIIKKINWKIIFCFPNFFVVALTQSRKALLTIILGILFLYILNVEKKITITNIIKLIFTLAIVAATFSFIINLSFMAGIKERIMDLILGLIYEQDVDASLAVRLDMIDIGIASFRESPILGHGIGTSGVILRNYYKDAYFHNNYVEILSGGGVFGIIIYYGVHIYLLLKLYKSKKYKSKYRNICLALLIVVLFMDYGLVTYRGKMNYIYLILCFLEILPSVRGRIDTDYAK